MGERKETAARGSLLFQTLKHWLGGAGPFRRRLVGLECIDSLLLLNCCCSTRYITGYNNCRGAAIRQGH